MKKISRNAPCPCGSGRKYKNCCGGKQISKLEGLIPGIRMKGGVRFDAEVNGFVPIVHIWQNVHCQGDPDEWHAPKVFSTESEAMSYYKLHIRPELERLMSKIENEISNGTLVHEKLE